MGVKHSPVVVPSWRDVAKDSDFLKKQATWAWPEAIPYYLIFSYQDIGYGDGVVSFESQLPMQYQIEARKVFAINNTHAGILQDNVFIDIFQNILSAHDGTIEDQ